MYRIVKNAFLAVIVLFVLGLFNPVQAIPVLSFDVSNSTPLLGDTVNVDIVISGAVNLFAFNIDMSFDSNVLSFSGISSGSFLGSGGLTLSSILGSPGFDNSTPGQIQDISDSLLGPVSGVSGNGILATITFSVIAGGLSTLDLLNLNSLGGTELIDDNGQSISISGSSAGSVSPVPEPKTLLLVAIGLGILALKKTYRHQ